jgi:hypothetical protein
VIRRAISERFSGCRRLRQLAATFEADPGAVVFNRPPIKAGTRLVRQWKEQVHVVEVETEGYEYRGAHCLQEQEFGGLSDAGLFNVGKEARRSVTDESGIVSP